ncbi:hypothetical protein GGP41_009103 [Bipolaris sorokiniana]|uniref:CENP-C homolog n=1 Tax=Cochliobolus sativus TaxID=45130 RepID=A0A8H5ZEJ5_COCSA|nr:hypothetical protein GGP41_009103 [Bipolaris sorokiniana]
MAPPKKRENRENNYYNVGVQGRHTGITLADKGVYDEHGLEPISGIFSSPEKSPPKRSGNATGSESMELQESAFVPQRSSRAILRVQNSSIPDFTTSNQLLRSNRTNLPPPRSRSPKKTHLGSSPRRQSSMVPRGSSAAPSSPIRASSHPIARRLDFEQDESSLEETPALSGSGARRGKRSDVYDIPEDGEESPLPEPSAMMEESMVQQELMANEESAIFAEESFVAQIGEESMADVEAVEEAVEELVDEEESEIVTEPVKQPGKRGRKRKSDAVDDPEKPRKRGPGAQASESLKGKKNGPASTVQRRRSQRVSDISELEASTSELPADTTLDESEQIDEAPVAPKRRGRPPRAQPVAEKENTVVSKPAKNAAAKEKNEGTFKKPGKPPGRPKANTEPKNKPPAAEPKTKPAPKTKESSKAKPKEKTSLVDDAAGKLVDVYGNPLSKQDIDQMSTTSAGSRFGRGRHLSVFREIDPENVARVGRTGRHRVAPIDFWKNDHISYDVDGSMTSIVKSAAVEETRRQNRKYGPKSKKKRLTMVEEEEIELDPWEEKDGRLVGNYKGYDPVINNIAWAEKGIQPREVGDGGFKFAKIGSSGSFFNWGLIELGPDQMKRTKNSRFMHMVFNVQSGTVEVRVHENEFTIHKHGIWQVPRGNTYSIRNIGSGTARVFFAQAKEKVVDVEE